MSAGSVVVGKQTRFVNAVRRNGSVTAAAEKRLLVWMAERVPAWVSSDGLTLLGFGAQIAAGACYALARYDRRWLALGIWCIVLNWLGDSLDGTLARVRQQQRPRYGFYVDHMVDAFGSVALMVGLGFSGLVHWPVAVAMLVGFLLLASESCRYQGAAGAGCAADIRGAPVPDLPRVSRVPRVWGCRRCRSRSGVSARRRRAVRAGSRRRPWSRRAGRQRARRPRCRPSARCRSGARRRAARRAPRSG